MEYDVHTILDMLTLTATAWVIYMMYVKLKTSYQADKDTLHEAYIVRLTSRMHYPTIVLSVSPCTAPNLDTALAQPRQQPPATREPRPSVRCICTAVSAPPWVNHERGVAPVTSTSPSHNCREDHSCLCTPDGQLGLAASLTAASGLCSSSHAPCWLWCLTR